MSDAGTKTPLSADRVPSGAEMKAAKPGREDPMVRMNINFLLAHKDYAIIPFVVAGLLAAAWTVSDHRVAPPSSTRDASNDCTRELCPWRTPSIGFVRNRGSPRLLSNVWIQTDR
jgi:hypothetical protein